jgi:hypothetical protein
MALQEENKKLENKINEMKRSWMRKCIYSIGTFEKSSCVNRGNLFQ